MYKALRVIIFEKKDHGRDIISICESEKPYTKKGFIQFITDALVEAAKNEWQVEFENIEK